MKVILQVSSIQAALNDMLAGTLTMVPKAITALTILVVGIIAAKIVRKIIKKALVTAKVDKLGESLNKIDVISKSNVKIELSTVFSLAIYYFIMLLVLILSSTALGMPEVTQLVSDILLFLPNLLVAMIILILGTLLADTLKSIVVTALKSLGVPSANMIATVLFYFLLINVILIAMKQAKIQTDFLAQNISIIIGGIAAAFAIGYGLASKDTMANLLASLHSRDVFKVGDKVTIDGVTGTISDIDKSKLTIDTGASMVILPLAAATNQKVEFHKD